MIRWMGDGLLILLYSGGQKQAEEEDDSTHKIRKKKKNPKWIPVYDNNILVSNTFFCL